MLYKIYIEKVKRKDVCKEYGVNDKYISRIGLDRWVNVYKEFIKENRLDIDGSEVM